MTFLSRLQELPICSIKLAGLDEVRWGRIISVSGDWIAMRTYENHGAIGPLVLFQAQDIEDVMFDFPNLAAHAQIRDSAPVDTPEEPAAILARWISERQVVTLWKGYSDEDGALGIIAEIDEDWICWTEFTKQSVIVATRVSRRDDVKLIEGDAAIEHRVEDRIA